MRSIPLFRQLRAAVKDQAELIAVSIDTSRPMDLSYGSGQEMEKANLQFVSGWMFGAFGLRPAVGRLLTENDDLKPGAHPVAVLSYDYWTRRFGQDPKVIGRTFRTGRDWRIGEGHELFEIVGVAEERFTGTEPGTVTDIFVPAMMHALVNQTPAALFRIFVRLPPGAAAEPIRDRLRAAFRALQRDTDRSHVLLMEPAAAGVSGMQRDYRQALAALGVLVALVLLIACANVANLMTAQGTMRAREMALRVSIGAGRSRLVQLVLVESAMLAFLAAAAGGAFAWWAAPFVVEQDQSAQQSGALVSCSGLAGAWIRPGADPRRDVPVRPGAGAARLAVKPASALKGGEDPHSRRRLMHALIAVQAAFCFLVLFVAGLFAATFDRLSHQPMGFSAERLLNLDTVTTPLHEPQVLWDQVAERLRRVPGVETVAFADWPLLTDTAIN